MLKYKIIASDIFYILVFKYFNHKIVIQPMLELLQTNKASCHPKISCFPLGTPLTLGGPELGQRWAPRSCGGRRRGACEQAAEVGVVGVQGRGSLGTAQSQLYTPPCQVGPVCRAWGQTLQQPLERAHSQLYKLRSCTHIGQRVLLKYTKYTLILSKRQFLTLLV